MTRDTKTLSAVFMAVLLVLASGTAVSLAVTDGESSAVGSNAAVQETTEVGQETTEAGNQETTEAVETTAAEGDGAGAESANVTFNEQESDGERIVIEQVTMEEGGFVAIHDQTLLDGDALGSVVGTSVYLEAGTHENVVITLGRPITESQPLIAMPHRDTNDNQVYDFVISGGEADGPYTATDGGAVVDPANVTVGDTQAETTTEEDVVETTTEEVEETTTEENFSTTQETDVIETTTEIDDVVETTTADEVEETTTEDEVEETTTEDVVEETTTADEGVIETTTEDEVEETTTEDEVEETTTEDEVEETTTEEVDDVETTTETEAPAGQQQFIFKVEQMNIDRWSFVVGDEETPDRTETISGVNVQDRRVEINLTEILQNQSKLPSDQVTTQDPEEVQEQVEDNLSGDIETVRFVIENVNVENVTFVITAPADMELPEAPDDVGPEMTTEEDDEVVETTTEEEDVVETTTEEVDDVETTEEVVETTTEEDVVETTTEEVEETTTVEDEDVNATTVEDEDEGEDVETTTAEVEETTTEDEPAETTTAADQQLESFDVSALNAPQSAEVGDTINVSAVVTNPNDAEATQDVAFRLQGTVVAREEVTLNASGSTTVEFQVDTTDVPPGEYIHGVYTRDFGDLAVITLNEPSAEETDSGAETETTGNETELPDDSGETTVGIETTTAGA